MTSIFVTRSLASILSIGLFTIPRICRRDASVWCDAFMSATTSIEQTGTAIRRRWLRWKIVQSHIGTLRVCSPRYCPGGATARPCFGTGGGGRSRCEESVHHPDRRVCFIFTGPLSISPCSRFRCGTGQFPGSVCRCAPCMAGGWLYGSGLWMDL